MLLMSGIGYTQREHILEIAEAPLNIARVAATQYELAGIKRQMVLDMNADNLPSNIQREFPDYIRQSMESTRSDISLDYWGNHYQIGTYQGDYEIWSFGPDEWDDTEDDVWVLIPVR